MMNQELPLSLRFCIRANKMSCFFLVALNLGLLVGVFPLIKDKLQTNAHTPTEALIFIAIIAAVFIVLHFPILIFRGLNERLSHADPEMMSKQVFWSCWFLLIFPIGTLLHLGVLYYMLFSRDTYELFDQNAWDAPKPYWGVVRFISVIAGSAFVFIFLIPFLLKTWGNLKHKMPARVPKAVSSGAGPMDAPQALMKGLDNLAEGQNKAFDALQSELGNSGSAVTRILSQAQKDGNARHEEMMGKIENTTMADVMGGNTTARKPFGSKTVKAQKAPAVKVTSFKMKEKNFFDKFIEKWFTQPSKPAEKSQAAGAGVVEGEKYDKETGNVFF